MACGLVATQRDGRQYYGDYYRIKNAESKHEFGQKIQNPTPAACRTEKNRGAAGFPFRKNQKIAGIPNPNPFRFHGLRTIYLIKIIPINILTFCRMLECYEYARWAAHSR